MNTTAYLHSHGWLGAGHGLHARGLSKPLLVSQKQNVLGVGRKRHDAHADQWWARAFDGCLKGLEVSRQEEKGNGEQGGVDVRVEGKGGGLDALRNVGGGGNGKGGGLYGCFVRGKGLRGTFVEEEAVVVGEVVEGVVTVTGEGAGAVEKRIDRKRREEEVGEERAERKRERNERKEREVVKSVAVMEEGVPDGEVSKRLRREERRGRRRARDAAKDGAVTATRLTETIPGSSLRMKKRRKVEASWNGGPPELVMMKDHVATETPVSHAYEAKVTDEEDLETMEEKEKSAVEEVERKRRKAVRKALKAERTRSGEGQAGQEADATNKTHRKKKRKHTEK